MDTVKIARELLGVAKVLASVGDTIRVRIPGIGAAMAAVPMVPRKWIQTFESSPVRSLVDRGMASHGFGRRQSGHGHFGSDHWEKGGKKYRVFDIDEDDLLLEEFMPPWM